MIMHLFSDMLILPVGGVPVDGLGCGFALGLVDDLALDLELIVVRRQVGQVGLVRRPRASASASSSSSSAFSRTTAGWALDAGHEVAHDLFGDVEATLELVDGLAGRIEDDDEVRALAVARRWGRPGGGGPTG